jgi:hypothetical protein
MRCDECEWQMTGPRKKLEGGGVGCEVWCGAGLDEQFYQYGGRTCSMFMKIYELEANFETHSHVYFRPEVTEWIEQNIPRTIITKPTKPNWVDGLRLRFYNDRDAVLFKLFWL